MAKNIVICSDGTGNTAIKGRGTNVFRIFEAVDLHGWKNDPLIPRQVVFYDDGVGTEDFKPLKLLGGAFGWGLKRNVQQLYTALARVYEPDDRIFLFGFSRGAFTVRTLAGLIVECGIISLKKCDTRQKLKAAVNEAYELYRRKYQTPVQRFLRESRRKLATAGVGSVAQPPTAQEQFRAARTDGGKVPIDFIGVWDTVDAVGLPFDEATTLWNAHVHCFKFPDYTLSPQVKQAAHALAIDDERRTFHPLLWDVSQETEERKRCIEQVWFAGVHSNVGGGYPKQGMSLVALDWMMARAEDAGLRFIKSDRDYYREHANVHDNLYDSRSGAAIYYRYKPRDIGAICNAHGVRPKIHISALERIADATQGYAPGNLPFDADVVVTDPMAPPAGKLREWLQTAGEDPPNLLADAGAWIRLRQWAHVLLIVLTAIVLICGWPESGQGGLLRTLKHLATPSGMWELARNVATRCYGIPFALLLALFVASCRARREMRGIFSRWWHPHRDDLRKALDAVKGRRIARGSVR